MPAVVDLATMREAMAELGGDAARINPLIPAELVIDHSVIADVFGRPDAFERNVEFEFQRNAERFGFLRWGQEALRQFKVVPPGTGIVHQVNIEHLARVIMTQDGAGDGAAPDAYPDTCLGTDSHTTMQNGLGVLGWGVGGIEAEAAMLGQPVSMLIPRVVGFRLTGELPDGATATDLVLTITELLRKHGVVGKFVEFYGEGVAAVPVANRATIGNMSPEFGSTCAIFPIDAETLTYLRLTGRSDAQVALVEAYAKEQGLWHEPGRAARYSEELELDLATVVPSLAGPKRPQDRVALTDAKTAFREALGSYVPLDSLDEDIADTFPASDPFTAEKNGAVHDGDARRCARRRGRRRPSAPVQVTLDDGTQDLRRPRLGGDRRDHLVHQHLQPLGDGRRGAAGQEGGRGRAGAQAVGEDHARAGLQGGHGLLRARRADAVPGEARLQPGRLRLHHLHRQLRPAARGDQRGGERQRPGRGLGAVRQPELRGPDQPGREDELPGLAAAGGRLRAGRHHGHRPDLRAARHREVRPAGLPADLWPSQAEIADVVQNAVAAEMFTRDYADVFAGDDRWRALDVPPGDTFAWDPESTYVRRPPYFDGMPAEPEPVTDIHGARVLALLGDSVTTDHISPAGAIKTDSPAGQYLTEHGVQRRDFNSYGSRRGNHEVMIRGTFANIRLRNQLAPGTEGGVTVKLPEGTQTSIYDASREYLAEGTPLLVLAGKEYGSGSSRDWAAKGTALLGVRAVLVESFERIHRSNLIGMGVLPLQYQPGESAESLGLTGHEVFDVIGIEAINSGPVPREVTVLADGREFRAVVRIDTPGEAEYYRHGGIMQYVLRSLLARG